MNKVILISIDGMRPDGLKLCKNNFLDELVKMSSYTFNARTVYPSVTLPCHMSMFHGVPPQLHGTTTNEYVVPHRDIPSIAEQIHKAGKRSAMFNSWEPLRNIANPGLMTVSEYYKISVFEKVDEMLTDKALYWAKNIKPDFIFLYLGETDDKGGHKFGWMSDEYLNYINTAMSCVKKVIETVGDEYSVIITADHGGHERCHGTDMPEDMIIPMFFYGKQFKPDTELNDVTILDIAPTIADILEVGISEEWEGKSLLCKK